LAQERISSQVQQIPDMYQYDEKEGRWRTALRYAHTVIPQTLGRTEFWLFFGLQVTLYITYQMGWIQHVPGFKNTSREQKIDWTQIKITIGFTVFFEVFFTNVCYQRYNDFYVKTRALFLDLLLIVFDLRTHLLSSRPSHARLCYRYFLASVLLFWEHVNQQRSVYSLQAVTKHFKPQLVLSKEQDFLDGVEPEHRYMMVLHWSMDVFATAHAEAALPANLKKMVLDKMQKAFLLMHAVEDQLGFPIPYPYFHLLNFMVCVNLILLAVCMGIAGSHLEVFVFFIADLIFLGMMELSAQLVDPFGDDEVDFPLSLWLRAFFERAELVLEYEWKHNHKTDHWRPLLKTLQEPLLLKHEKRPPNNDGAEGKSYDIRDVVLLNADPSDTSRGSVRNISIGMSLIAGNNNGNTNNRSNTTRNGQSWKFKLPWDRDTSR